MKKWILIGLAAVIAIVLIAVIVVVSKLGPIIKTAINTYGPDITKTVLKVDDVGISIFSGKASVKGFVLGNPRGFSARNAMSVRDISVGVDKGSLTKDTIIINSVEIIGPDIIYEKEKGTDNFKAIMHNVQQSIAEKSPKGKTEEKKGEKKPEKKIIIRDLIIRDGKVTLVQAPFGDKAISAKLPDIHLTNVGSKNGASSAQVADEVIKALYAKITSSAVTDALNQQLKSLTGGVPQGITKGTGGIKGLLGK